MTKVNYPSISYLPILLIIDNDNELKLILNKSPEKHDLVELLADYNFMYYEIGVYLKVPNATLMGLKQGVEPNMVKLSQVLQKWIETQCSDYTWKTILGMTKSKTFGGNVGLSKEIEEKLTTTLYDKYLKKPDWKKSA